nr:DUF4388 domain-containing protein [uncultured Desulfobulbus sp.]
MSEPQVPPNAKSIDGISLASFLQLLEHERKSCTLVVTQGDLSGEFFFQDGNLIQALHKGLQGLDAAYCILSWEKATFYLAKPRKQVQTINHPLAHILLTASTKSDERRAEQKTQAPVAGKGEQNISKNQGLGTITSNLLAIEGVQEYYLLNRQGKLVAQSCQSQKMADFIAYSVVSGIQMREALGSKGLHNIRIRLADESVLLIVPASGAIIGLLLTSDADLAVVYPKLRKALARKSS